MQKSEFEQTLKKAYTEMMGVEPSQNYLDAHYTRYETICSRVKVSRAELVDFGVKKGEFQYSLKPVYR